MTKKKNVWTPTYATWRHGGWYVTNFHHSSGACGCVSRNYPDHKWRIVCGDQSVTYPSRDAAARAERYLATKRTAPDIEALADTCGVCGEIHEATP